MNKILETRSNLLNSLDVGKIIESTEASTVKGTEIRSRIINQFESLSDSVSGLMHIREAFSQYAPIDKGLYTIVEKIDEALIDNSFEFKTIFCHESLSGSKDAMKIKASKNLEEIMSKNIDEAKASIRNGMFNGFISSLPMLSLLTEEAKIKTEELEDCNKFEVTTPYSYVEESNSGLSIRLGNKVFSIIGEKLIEAASPSPKFSYISSVVENLVKFNTDKQSFIYVDESQTIEVNRQEIKRILGENVSTYETSSEFAKNMKLVVESNGSKSNLGEIVDALISLKENYDNISKADNFILINKKTTNETFAAGKINDNHIILTLSSTRLPSMVENHDSAIEAIKSLNKKSGYDASSFFSDSLIKENKLIESKNAEYQERTSVVKTIEAKIDEIDNHIREARNAGNIEREESLLKNRSVAESLLIEQKTEISKLFK